MVSIVLTPLWTSRRGTLRTCDTSLPNIKLNPQCRVWPFHDLTEAERASTKVIPKSGLFLHALDTHVYQDVDFSKTPIHAIFVYHDPRNWALDTQIICDVLQSGGIIGGSYNKKHDKNIELIFCNPDLLWRSDFERPRIGQGGFRVAFQAVYKVCTFLFRDT